MEWNCKNISVKCNKVVLTYGQFRNYFQMFACNENEHQRWIRAKVPLELYQALFASSCTTFNLFWIFSTPVATLFKDSLTCWLSSCAAPNRAFVITTAKLDLSYSLTLLTSLSDPTHSCVIDLHTNSNTQWDFASFVLFCLQHNHLTAGDYLIMDNAR